MSQDCVVLLDCRPVFSFSSCHISGAVNINLASVMRKRFMAGKIGLPDLISSPHCKTLLQNGGSGKVVVYDESTTDPNSLSSNTTAHLVIMALSKMGNTPLLLKGLSLLLSSLLPSSLQALCFLFKHRFGREPGFQSLAFTLCQCPTLLFLSSSFSFSSFSSFPASTSSLSSLSPFLFYFANTFPFSVPLSPLSPLFLSLFPNSFHSKFPICLLLCCVGVCTAGGICEFGVLHPSLCEVSVTPVQRAISAGPRATTPGQRDQALDWKTAPPVFILSFLVLGSQKDAHCKQVLQEFGVKYILNVTTKCPNYHEEDKEFEYKRIAVTDTGTQKLSQHFREAFEYCVSV
ncbi:Dual specificity protein phosphatase 10 [Geodia barretti]|uniref:protein-tyrosine-phosphatase n=1 Tax=Geodia barretti TaxID=519541 RepID=A0AA35X2F0_GEOBA|nr:Dual specificity protein phosphatase 10 [Geodia barretti]